MYGRKHKIDLSNATVFSVLNKLNMEALTRITLSDYEEIANIALF